MRNHGVDATLVIAENNVKFDLMRYYNSMYDSQQLPPQILD